MMPPKKVIQGLIISYHTYPLTIGAFKGPQLLICQTNGYIFLGSIKVTVCCHFQTTREEVPSAKELILKDVWPVDKKSQPPTLASTHTPDFP